MKAPQQTRLQVHVWTTPATAWSSAERCASAQLERDGEVLLTLFTHPDRQDRNLFAWVEDTHCGLPRVRRGSRLFSLIESDAERALQALLGPLDFKPHTQNDAIGVIKEILQ